MDVKEQSVIGYSPAGGYLIRGQCQDLAQQVLMDADNSVTIEMADALDQRVFGAGTAGPVVVVHSKQDCDGNVRRYLARYSTSRSVTGETTQSGEDGRG